MYTDEENILMVISLLKQHGIKQIIVSPGATNVSFVNSIQQDDFFEIYSCVDERSAAYMAVGLSVESGEPVVINCTGATASRNYVPGLTEAFYRKVPILAITSTQCVERVGHNIPQVIDRSEQFRDLVKKSVLIPRIESSETRWANEVKINDALLELRHAGGGPVHINLETIYSKRYGVNELPAYRKIERFSVNDKFPEISGDKNVLIFSGPVTYWNKSIDAIVDRFCERYGAFMLCDHGSPYKGKYRFDGGIIASQDNYFPDFLSADILIHIGEISGSYYTAKADEVWRVNPDGVLRDEFRRLKYVFEMKEYDFFSKYAETQNGKNRNSEHFRRYKEENISLMKNLQELPFSNAWCALQTADKLPENSVLHLGILNSLRCWNYFMVSDTVRTYSNTGGFGIDGGLSTLVGASLIDRSKLYFGVFGDLSTFYDLNILGNRHIGNNLRILVINNGIGTEFKNYIHAAADLGDDTDRFIAAAGHNGNKSRNLLKHFTEDLGFLYLSAENKEEYLKNLPMFICEDNDKSVIFEVFTNHENENQALYIMRNQKHDDRIKAKKIVHSILGEKGTAIVKKMIKR